MEKKKTNTKLILKGIGAFLIYFLISEFAAIPFYLLGVDLETVSTIIKCIYTIIIQLIIILLIFLLFRDYIIKSFNDFKENHNKYFKTYFKYWFVLLGLMALSNGLIMLIDPSATAKNQDAVNELFKQLPVYTFILSVFLAPVVEELAFRLSFRAIFKNKYLFIFFSGILFGSFHVIGSFENAIDLLYIIPYSVPGWIFAYTLQKSDNIFVPMSLHFLHNGILMSIQVFILLFGIAV
jgi:membrane protease YdiL (CAAX protease family)